MWPDSAAERIIRDLRSPVLLEGMQYGMWEAKIPPVSCPQLLYSCPTPHDPGCPPASWHVGSACTAACCVAVRGIPLLNQSSVFRSYLVQDSKRLQFWTLSPGNCHSNAYNFGRRNCQSDLHSWGTSPLTPK